MIHPQKITSALTLVFPRLPSSCHSLFEVSSSLWLGTVLSGAVAPVCCKWKKERREEGGREGRREKGGREEGKREGGAEI